MSLPIDSIPALNKMEQEFRTIYQNATAAQGFDPLTADFADYMHLRRAMLPEVDIVMKAQGQAWHRIPRYTNDILGMGIENDIRLNDCYIRYLPMDQHATESYEMFLCISGQNRHYIGENAIDLSPGDVLLIAPGVMQASGAFSEECVRRAVHIRRSSISQSMRPLLSSGGLLARFLTETHEGHADNTWCIFHSGPRLLEDPYLRLLSSLPRGDSEILISLENNLLMAFLESLDSACGDTAHLETGSYTDVTDAILHCIHMELATIDRRQLADRFNYSERQLLRIVQKKTGMTFKEYVTKIRMDYVTEQLTRSEYPILRILESAGYENNRGFYDQFHARFGMTPTEYRIKNQPVI